MENVGNDIEKVTKHETKEKDFPYKAQALFGLVEGKDEEEDEDVKK